MSQTNNNQNKNAIDQSIEQVFVEQNDDDIKKLIEKQKQPRCFTKSMKDQCWKNPQLKQTKNDQQQATIMIGRHPDRWRLDAVGNPVLRALTSCLGPLCHEYDHITPFSKGGKTEISNCQILQTMVNRFKSNKVNHSHKELIAVSSTNKFTNQEFDAVERAVYGDLLKIDAEQQVKEASRQSLQIIYAQKELNQQQNTEIRQVEFDLNLNQPRMEEKQQQQNGF